MQAVPSNPLRSLMSPPPAAGSVSADFAFPRAAPNRCDAIGVVIVAHNQEGEIERCVRGVFAAHHRIGWTKPLWVVIVADACTDATAKVGRQVLNAFGEVVTIAARSERISRDVGAAVIRRHFQKISPQWILLSHAGAGGQVPLDWFDRQLWSSAANECHIGPHRRTS